LGILLDICDGVRGSDLGKDDVLVIQYLEGPFGRDIRLAVLAGGGYEGWLRGCDYPLNFFR
jgi:hypothetical protein